VRCIVCLLFVCSAIAWGHGQLPIGFEPNRGQASSGIDFLARGKGYVLELRANRASLRSRRARVTTILEGASSRRRGEARELLPGVVSYLRHNPDHSLTGIPTYRAVRYRGVYRGIDVVYYGGAKLEYDFVLAPGADPRRIRIRYEGLLRALRLNDAGDLEVATAGGMMRQHRPVAYQEIAGVRKEIASRYVLHGRTVSFVLDPYDRSLPLVIDPALTWATYVGGSAMDSAEALVVDASGNTYVAGWTVDPTYGDADAFVAKLSADGTAALFTTVFPGSYDDLAHAVGVDSSGDVYVAGETSSPDFYADTTYLSARAQAGYQHVFVSKLDPSGRRLIYSHYVGGAGAEIAYGLAVDVGGSAYVVGGTTSSDFLVSNSGAVQTGYAGNTDAFAIKFDSTGRGVYSTFLGGSQADVANAVVVDSGGNAYITGQTNSTNFPIQAGYQAKNAGGQDAFVVKLSSSGGLVFSTYLGGSGDEGGNGIAVDSAGAVYVTGETASSDFPTVGAMQPAFAGGAGDIFVTKLNADGGSLAYSTYLGGTGEDVAYGVAVDGAGNAYLTGGTTSTDLPVADAFQATNQGSANAVVAALDPTGVRLVFASYLGGSGTTTTSGAAGDYGYAIAVSCSAGVTVAGTTASADFPVTANVYQTAYAGAGDAFVARIAAGGSPAINAGGVVNTMTLGPGPVAPGSLVSILGTSLAMSNQTAAGVPWDTTLGGAIVAINGNAVPIAAAGATRLDFQLPYEVGVGNAVAMVTVPCGTSAPVVFPVARAAPYIQQDSSGDAVALNQDYSANSAANPAKAGSVLILTLTGIGPVDNAVATGAAAPDAPLSQATLPKSATIGGQDAPILFLGLAPGKVGLAQANVLIPALSPGAYPVTITVGGVTSNGPAVYVQ
jgi:uncharacterized protein (TIGR03437 family)